MRESRTSLVGAAMLVGEVVAKQKRRNEVSPDVSCLEAGQKHSVAPIDG